MKKMKNALIIALLGSLALVAGACSGGGVNNGNNANATKTTVVAPATDHPHNANGSASPPHNDNGPAAKPSPEHRDPPGAPQHNHNVARKP